jgi:hypothetical protein
MPSAVAFPARQDKHAEEVADEKLANEAYRWADAMLKSRKSVTGSASPEAIIAKTASQKSNCYPRNKTPAISPVL